MAKPRRSRVVLEPTGAMPVVEESGDRRISTGELRALVDGDVATPGSSPAAPVTPAAPTLPPPSVPAPRRAPQIDPALSDLLASMGIDPEKVTPKVLEDLGIGGLSTTELAAFLTQPTKPAPLSAAPSPAADPDTPALGLGPTDFRPEPKISGRRAATPAPVPAAPAPEAPAAAAPVAPEPSTAAPEPQSTPTPKPLRMANTFAPMTGKLQAVRRAPEEPATPAPMPLPPTAPPPGATPARGVIAGATPPRGLIAGATPARGVEALPDPAPFQLEAADFAGPPTPLPYEIDVDSMSLEMPAEEQPYLGQPTGAYDLQQNYHDEYPSGAYQAYLPDPSEAFFRADTGMGEVVELPSLSEAATYSQELSLAEIDAAELPAVETTGTMVGIGDPMRRTSRRAAAAASHGRPTVPLTAGAAAVLAAISGVALTGGPATVLAADDTRLVGATALGGQSALASVGDRGTAVTRDSERSATDDAASTRAKALAGVDVKADKQDKFLKSNLWVLPIPLGQYHITGTFGQPGAHWASVHTGLDFAAPLDTPIHAIARGTVTETAWAGPYGNRTIVTLPDGTEIWYCHQVRYGAQVGEKVSPGQIMGYVGATGNVTGPHVHVEVRPGGGDPVDPDVAMAEHGADPTP